MTLTREQLLQPMSLESTTMTVDGLGDITLREMNGADRDTFESKCQSATKKGDFRGLKAWLVATCLVDAKGNRLLQDSDVDAFGQNVSGRVLDQLFRAAQDLNRLTDEDVQELAGN